MSFKEGDYVKLLPNANNWGYIQHMFGRTFCLSGRIGRGRIWSATMLGSKSKSFNIWELHESDIVLDRVYMSSVMKAIRR